MEGPGFHERGYYTPGDRESFVHRTAAGRIGVAICYDRHFPEYMRGLRLAGAELVVVPQAGAVGEWTEGIFEAELQVAAFQNGYFAALANRVGRGGRPRVRRRVVRRRSRRPGHRPGAPRARPHPLRGLRPRQERFFARGPALPRRPPAPGLRGHGTHGPGAERPLMQRWYVVNTRPKKESQVERLFSEGGFTVYCPKYVREKRIVPFFPGYAFLRFEYPEQFQMVKYTRGVKRVVGNDAGPIPIPEETVEGIRARERDGLVDLREVRPGAGRRRRDRGRRGPAQGSERRLPQRDRRQRAGDDPPELRLLPGPAAHRKRQAEEGSSPLVGRICAAFRASRKRLFEACTTRNRRRRRP